ncbi:MAG: PLDc N-terminal domain-containing protein [Firmicutes bacterium]|nr:PLDc N-terminal domain-containing protein [Bacillota bacterium]
MNIIKEYLPFFIPILFLQLALLIASLIHILKNKKFRFGNTVMWVLIVVLINIIGPILYFTIGKADE